MVAFERFHLGKFWRFGGIPSPHPSEWLDWRGVCKKCLQNLEPQGFKGQNIDNKGLAVFFATALDTASALNMICSFGEEGKVRCHMRLWKKRGRLSGS
jgi:hypothetical protein